MSSGKSTLISEYLHFTQTVEFNPPPIKVTHEGLAFEFIDSVFAIERGGDVFNFYELDAPTISKWYQFLEIADAVVVVYNLNPRFMYGSHEKFGQHLIKYVKKDAPIIYALNNLDGDEDEAKVQLAQYYDLSTNHHPIEVVAVTKGIPFFDEVYGSRTELKKEELERLYNTVLNLLSDKKS